jgi:hypothetical protein
MSTAKQGVPPWFTYFEEVLTFPIAIEGLPETLEYEGSHFVLKPRLWISLLPVKHVLDALVQQGVERAVGEQRVLDVLSEPALWEQKLVTGRFRELRYAQRDDLQTVLALVDLPGAEAITDHINHRLDLAIPQLPIHTTLYILPGKRGIGLWNQSALNSLTKRIEPEQVPSLAAILGL